MSFFLLQNNCPRSVYIFQNNYYGIEKISFQNSFFKNNFFYYGIIILKHIYTLEITTFAQYFSYFRIANTRCLRSTTQWRVVEDSQVGRGSSHVTRGRRQCNIFVHSTLFGKCMNQSGRCMIQMFISTNQKPNT